MTFKIRHAVALACAVALPVSTWAAETDESSGVLEEIVITAQKRTERLEDVPVAAAVLSTDMMASTNAGDIFDLNRLVPSVQLKRLSRSTVACRPACAASPRCRTKGTIGLSSGVAIMINDGVPSPGLARRQLTSMTRAVSKC
ncbi:MAG: hypothetical protein U1F30_15060 [Steroidobacteraceae bacterium]